MADTVRVVNTMRELRLDAHLDLNRLHHHLPQPSKLYRGRPQMLVITMTSKRNLQVFPSGVVQVMGNLSHSDALSMTYELLHHLQSLHPQLRMKPLTLRNMVVSVQLTSTIPLHRIKASSTDMSFEAELFPAVLIRHFHPVHVAVFHTGRCILTGLKSVEQAQQIVHELIVYLKKNDLLYSFCFHSLTGNNESCPPRGRDDSSPPRGSVESTLPRWRI